MSRLGDWLEDRARLRSALRWALDEPVPGGARVAYVFGSTLLALIAAQVATGIGLALYYSPSEATAWASVWWIQTRVALGWFLRGVHHHGASVTVVVLVLHLAQTLLFGAYKKPRELNWIVGVLPLLLVLGFALTGYLLPWDQRGYWATRVATAMAGTAPLVGGVLERVAQGGDGYGTLTLTRFYALHAIVLPLALLALVGAHVALFRRRGVTPPPSLDAAALARRARFWPDQAALDAVAAALALGAVAVLAVRGHGAPLEAPADPALAPLPRPEWYFLGLFQLQKIFQGPLETVGTLVVPGVGVALLLLLPFLDRAPGRTFRERRTVLAAALLGLAGYGALTAAAIRHDRLDPAVAAAQAEAAREAERANALAARGIPPEGPAFMLANDPPERGRRVFAAECAGCHTIAGAGAADPKAPDLAGLFSLDWVREQVRDPNQLQRFGRTKLKGKMDAFGRRLAPERLDAVARFIHARREPARADADPAFEEGRKIFGRAGCDECHGLRAGEVKDAPNLHDYGSDRYLRALLENPAAPLHFGPKGDGMPAMKGRLGPDDLTAIVAYLRTLEGLPVHRAQQAMR
ncbi:MAG: cytochrome b N-terminal domain-containing protein [Anaeromyxobacteraceae bacterium]